MTTQTWISPNGVEHGIDSNGRCFTCGRIHYKSLSELLPGDVVKLPKRGVARTVREVKPTGYLAAGNKRIFAVLYVEGDTPEWSAGNSGIATSVWELVR
jgi:hypothetical protein